MGSTRGFGESPCGLARVAGAAAARRQLLPRPASPGGRCSPLRRAAADPRACPRPTAVPASPPIARSRRARPKDGPAAINSAHVSASRPAAISTTRVSAPRDPREIDLVVVGGRSRDDREGTGHASVRDRDARRGAERRPQPTRPGRPRTGRPPRRRPRPPRRRDRRRTDRRPFRRTTVAPPSATVDQQPLDLALRDGRATRLLADVDPLGVGWREVEQRGGDEPVVDDDVGRRELPRAADRDQLGIAGSRADEAPPGPSRGLHLTEEPLPKAGPRAPRLGPRGPALPPRRDRGRHANAARAPRSPGRAGSVSPADLADDAQDLGPFGAELVLEPLPDEPARRPATSRRCRSRGRGRRGGRPPARPSRSWGCRQSH